jgi:hypothetical protein
MEVSMNKRPTDVVSASEIAAWEWCPEACRLAALGIQPLNKEELASGERFHARGGHAPCLSGPAERSKRSE